MYIIRTTNSGIIAGKVLKIYREGIYSYYKTKVIYNSEYNHDIDMIHLMEAGKIVLYKEKKRFVDDLMLAIL